MFPWKSLEHFVDILEEGIIYEDDKIVAIEKGWGVGVHRSHPTIKKQNFHLVEAMRFGDPRFCLDDALPLLSIRLKANSLKTIRPLDRFESGVVLLAKGEDGERAINRAVSRARCSHRPHLKFWCVTKGYPVINGNFLSEKVTLKKIDADELAEYKEPIIVDPKSFTRTFKHLHEKDFTTADVELHVLDSNTQLAVSLVEIATTSMKFNFVRCYAASKTSFIIGDTRFAKRVRHVLGTPFTLSPGAVPTNDDFEPLPFPVRKRLLVSQNSHVPLLSHLQSIWLPGYGPKKTDIIIKSKKLPEHFDWSLHRLFLAKDIRSNMTRDEQQEK